LKPAVSKVLNELLAPIQAAFAASKEWQEVADRAYPPPPKKEKKVKNRGTRFPGAQKEKAEKDRAELEKSVEKAAEKSADGVALPDRTVEGS
jgi:tyrosyl-tRNA synthetase